MIGNRSMNKYETRVGSAIIQEIRDVMEQSLRLPFMIRLEFVVGVSACVQHLVDEYGLSNGMPEFETETIGDKMYEYAQQFHDFDIAESSALRLVALYLKARTMHGDEARRAVALCEINFSELAAEAGRMLIRLEETCWTI